MPIKNKPKKRELLQKLRESRRKGDNLELELRFKKMDDKADEIEAKTEELAKQTKALVGALMEEWMGTAAPLEKKMNKINFGLQKVIRDIKKDIKIAQNVVKAVGYLDDAIEIATKLLKYM